MAATATLNVRMPEDLKRNGDIVSVSDAVRGLYRFLESEQDVPAWVLCERREDAFGERRRLLREIAGIAPLPDGFSLDDVKRERLARFFEDGEAR